MVAAMTESEQGIMSEKAYMTSLVDRDNSTRWASCLAVEFE